MKQLKTALFDFDGVVVDTEPIYDLFWNDAAKRYGLGIDNFADIIKGTTTGESRVKLGIRVLSVIQ